MSQTTLLERARALMGKTALAALPLAAATPAADAAQLTHDYSFAGEYSGSGFFLSQFDEGAADASTQGLGFKLTGGKTVQDSLFWNWNDDYHLNLRRYDITGIAFAWGGGIDGTLNPGDTLTAPYDFSIDFSHTTPAFPTYDSVYVGWELMLGFRDSAYTPGEWQPGPQGGSLGYRSVYGSAEVAGSHPFQGLLEFQVGEWEAAVATDWFVVLTVEWHDALARPGYEDTHGSLNGDFLTVTVPNRSIDVDILPAAPVPEPETYALMLAGLGLLGLRRRLSR